jgi:Flp pilus assembly protein TadG
MRNMISHCTASLRVPLRPLRRNQRGGVAVLVAVLLGGGVLVGMGAMVVDVGQLYSERAQLQNGADAAAIAVGMSCARGTCQPSLAAGYANANAADGAANVNQVCGAGTALTPCSATSGAITDCPPLPASGTTYVDVHTSTKTSSGGTLLPPVFARALLGNGSYSGSTVYACARAAWGGPSSAQTIALTISACEWDAATQNGTVFGPPPPYPPNPLPSPSVDQQLVLHTSKTNVTGCSTEPAGSDGPGLFGWTNDQTGTCSVFVSGGTYTVSTGVSAGSTCQNLIASAQANRTLVYIPVYTSVAGTGQNGTYTLKGFAAFVITGYHLPGFSASDWLNPNNDCHGSTQCINGYFTHGLIASVGTPGGVNLGATIVTLTG